MTQIDLSSFDWLLIKPIFCPIKLCQNLIRWPAVFVYLCSKNVLQAFDPRPVFHICTQFHIYPQPLTTTVEPEIEQKHLRDIRTTLEDSRE